MNPTISTIKGSVALIVTLLVAVLLINQYSPNFASIPKQAELAQVVSSLSNGLVGYWPLNEGSGTVANDNSGGGNNGALVNYPTWTTVSTGEALSFDGATNYVELIPPNNGGATAADFSTGDFSACIWANPNSGDNQQYLFDKYKNTSGDIGWRIEVNAGGSIEFGTLGSTGNNISATLSSSGTFHLICGVRSGTQLQLWLDDVEATGTDTGGPTNISNSVAALRIGAIGSVAPNSLYQGQAYGARIYNRALSSAEIQSLYSSNQNPELAQAIGPVISNITTTNITSTSATIDWSTNESANSQINYGLTSAYGNSTSLDSTMTTTHSENVSSLQANTQYHFQISSTDGSGNLSTSTDQTFTTSAQIVTDTTPPSVPTNLSASAVSSSAINISWTASTDNVAVTGYRIYRNGTQITTTTSTSYSDTGLTANTSYSYTVSAYDGAGNVSAQSSSASATTQAVVQQVSLGQNIYLTQSGGGNGTSCSNAQSVTWFNTTSNWGSGTNQIGPGDTVHLCGTFTAPAGSSGYLSLHGSGTSGNPITIFFEPNTVITAPYWGTDGAIYANGFNFLVIDGGTNGAIQATANGGELANQQNGSGIFIQNSNNSIVRNLNISNIYVHANDLSDEAGQSTDGILFDGGANESIYDNTVHDAKWCIRYGFPPGQTNSNISIYGNTSYNCDHGFVVGSDNANATLTNISVYSNTVHDNANWDDSANDNHHDGIHVWSVSSGDEIDNLNVYDNTMYGQWGINFNSFVYEEGHIVGANTFNNVLTSSSNSCGAGYLAVAGHTNLVAQNISYYNNTIVGSGTTQCVLFGIEQATNVTVENNIGSTADGVLYIPSGLGTTITNINNNLWFNFRPNGSPFAILGTNYFASTDALAFAQYQSGSGYDANGLNADPQLINPSSLNFHLQSTSPAIGAGANLTSLCGSIPALCTDYAGTSRVSTGAWDIGAYQYCTSNCQSQVQTKQQTAPVVQVNNSGGGGTSIVSIATPIATSTVKTSPVPVVKVTPPVTASVFTRTLSFGIRGSDVSALQDFLDTHGFPVSLTGAGSVGQETLIYGTLTRIAMMKFQVANNISPTGALDTPTIALVNQLIQKSAPVTTTATQSTQTLLTTSLSLGKQSPEVIVLQHFLNTHGFVVADSGTGSLNNESSYFGIKTYNALIQFQDHYAQEILTPSGLTQGTGYLGQNTIREINSLIQ